MPLAADNSCANQISNLLALFSSLPEKFVSLHGLHYDTSLCVDVCRRFGDRMSIVIVFYQEVHDGRA